jgi:hypothetical protein
MPGAELLKIAAIAQDNFEFARALGATGASLSDCMCIPSILF